jgi:hypothetical protein
MWAVDDIWLSGQMARRGIPVWLHSSRRRLFVDLPGQHDDHALYRQTIEGADRDAANRACVLWMRENYGIWSAGD